MTWQRQGLLYLSPGVTWQPQGLPLHFGSHKGCYACPRTAQVDL